MRDGDSRAEGGATAGRLRGVLFDLGGTLFSYADRAGMGKAMDTALRRVGLDPESPEVRAARRRASEAVQRDYASRSFFLHQDLFTDRVTRTAGLLGVEVPAPVLEQFRLENVRNIIAHMPARDDAATVLAGLRSRGLYCAVVSNADDAWVEPSLRRRGLDHLLDDWTSSEEARSCKPDTRIFELALAKAALEPHEVIYVGDSLHHDVAGAHAAGMRAVHLVDQAVPTPLAAGLEADTRPDARIERLSDLLAIVDDGFGHA